MTDKPSAGDSWRNWRDSELPLLERLRVAIRNNTRKVRRGHSCCGHHGEPGC